MEKQELLNVQMVSVYLNTSVQTIAAWYRWKKLHPEHELAKLLPDYVRIGNKNTRYWTKDDIYKLIMFKQSIPQGRNGILGEVTQKYVKSNFRNRAKENANGKKSNSKK